MCEFKINKREFAVVNKKGIILRSENWDKVYDEWKKTKKGYVLVEIFNEDKE